MIKQEKIAEWAQIYLKHINTVSIDVHVKKGVRSWRKQSEYQLAS